MRSIQVYFENENDAVRARIQLEKFNVSELEVGRLHQSDQDSEWLIVPLAGAENPDTASAAGHAAGGSKFPLLGNMVPELFKQRQDPSYVLTGKVPESDYEQISEILASCNGHSEP